MALSLSSSLSLAAQHSLEQLRPFRVAPRRQGVTGLAIGSEPRLGSEANGKRALSFGPPGVNGFALAEWLAVGRVIEEGRLKSQNGDLLGQAGLPGYLCDGIAAAQSGPPQKRKYALAGGSRSCESKARMGTLQNS